MAVSTGDILEVTIQGLLYGQRMMTVLHYSAVGPFTHTDPQLAADDFLVRTAHGATYDLLTPYLSCITNNFTCDLMTAQVIEPTRYVRSTTNPALTGIVTAAALTPNTAAVIEKFCAQAGRRFRGSVHIPGIADTQYSNGLISSTLLSNMDLLGAALLVPVIETGGVGVWNPVIWHRKDIPSTGGTRLTGTKSQGTVRVMRRRTVGVGK